MIEKFLLGFWLVLVFLGLSSCRQCPKNPPSTTYVHYGICTEYNEYLCLNTFPDSTFYIAGPGIIPGRVICGRWKSFGDSLFLTIELS
jgi:hypothetical protein